MLPLTQETILALELAKYEKPTPAAMDRVAKRTSAEAARWAFLQWNLRARAAAKFSKASEMLFDREGLAMASGELVSGHRAQRFPDGALVADLTTGIGGDLISLAARGPAIGFELDPNRAALADYNLGVYGRKASVRVEDSLESSGDWEYAVADPARRDQGARTLRPESFIPTPEQLAAQMRMLRLAAIKLSPMLPNSYLQTLGAEIEFVSSGGECKEAVVWLGVDAKSGIYASKVGTIEHLSISPAPYSGKVETYTYEADPAAIRADGLGSLADQFDLVALGDSNGYLSGSSVIESPWLTGYKVLADVNGGVKNLKQELIKMGCSTPIIKSRTPQAKVEDLRKVLNLKGDNPAIVMAYADKKSVKFLIVEKLIATR